jgi:hypothetical protein
MRIPDLSRGVDRHGHRHLISPRSSRRQSRTPVRQSALAPPATRRIVASTRRSAYEDLAPVVAMFAETPGSQIDVAAPRDHAPALVAQRRAAIMRGGAERAEIDPILGSELPPADDPRDEVVAPDEPRQVTRRGGGRIEQRREQPLVAIPGAAGRRHDREAAAYPRLVSLCPCHIRKATHPHASLRIFDGLRRAPRRHSRPRKAEGAPSDQPSSNVKATDEGVALHFFLTQNSR